MECQENIMSDNLDVLFSPKSVAVIGASSNPSKWGNWAAEQVIRHKSIRNVYFVNPKCEVIFDKLSLSWISEIPEPLDVAIITVPLSVFESTVDSLLIHGTKVIVGITTGFSERDNKGYDLERRIVEKCHKVGTILIGPNCAGVWDNYSPFHCLPIAEFPTGPVGLISQSGGVITDVAIRLQEINLGFSKIVSTGNQADARLPVLLHALDRDRNTKVIALYIENERSIPYFLFQSLSKPVVLMTPETTPASRHASLLHTNSLPSNTEYVENAANSNGAFFARNIRDFVATIQMALSRPKHVSAKRTVIVTDTGGLGILTAAAIEQSALVLHQPSQQLKDDLAKVLIDLPQAVISNPIDMVNTKGGFTKPTVDILKFLQKSEEVDAMIFVLFHVDGDDLFTNRQIGYQIGEAVTHSRKPVVFVCKNLNTVATQELLQHHVPIYRDIETAVKMLEQVCG
jgi:acetate---CoA ligase (ADP-forming)